MSTTRKNVAEMDRGTEGLSYEGYRLRHVPAHDPELTHTGPDTPMGEYMRRFWQPLCLSEQVRELPHAVRILGEDLVVFRDGQNRIGVLAKHCCHRGASLEFGIVQDQGIKCCYHGTLFDIDGRVLDVPAEPDPKKQETYKRTVCQGAYPAYERDGLIFAYMGPPEEKPGFPEYDAYHSPSDSEKLAFTNVYPCNWLQVQDNIADQMHTAFLHNAMVVDGEDPEPTSLSSAFREMPVLDYKAVRNKTAMVFIASRRVDDDKVWVRINDVIIPNMTQHAYLFEDGAQRRLFHRVHMTRWYVPIDDENSLIFGWRYFGPSIDPYEMGQRDRMGWDDMDFLEGQVGNRSYEQGQRAPGDWEAVCSQRAIAVHAAEHPMSSDIGVYLARRLLRDAVREANPSANPTEMHRFANTQKMDYCYTQNTILTIPRLKDPDMDQKMVGKVGDAIVKLMEEGDNLPPDDRERFVIEQLEKLEKAPPRP